MKIKSHGTFIIHALSFCQDCEWQEDTSSAYDDMSRLRNQVYKHIRATGHTVNIETGYTAKYSPKEVK